MPAYDYRCISCDTVFEIRRSIGDSGDVACPACGAASKRLFTPVGVVFKGSGFHNTDYRVSPTKEEPPSAEKGSCSDAGAGEACASCPAGE
jgi:putative FmdB family regulatory protein